MTPQKAQDYNRLDHILPRGYLEGFAIPSKEGRLYAFNIEQRNWFETGTGKVAAARGFYDYSLDGQPDATADEAFLEFETKFPSLRRELVATNFSDWQKHREFLVSYSQMLRARSVLFRKEVLKQANSSLFLKLGEVVQTRPSVDRPGETEVEYRYSDFEPETAARRDALLKNLSITQMRAEIARGAGDFAGWNWSLHYTMDVTKPFITSDNAVGLIGFVASRTEAMMRSDSLFVFPLCWQACLIGSLAKVDVETTAIHPAMLGNVQDLYLNRNDCRFAYSPYRVPFSQA